MSDPVPTGEEITERTTSAYLEGRVRELEADNARLVHETQLHESRAQRRVNLVVQHIRHVLGKAVDQPVGGLVLPEIRLADGTVVDGEYCR